MIKYQLEKAFLEIIRVSMQNRLALTVCYSHMEIVDDKD